MIDRVTAERIFDELIALRESVSDVHAVTARVEERMAGFAFHHDERARKHSDRLEGLESGAAALATTAVVERVDARLKALEVWRWVLVGAWFAVPVCWVVFTFVNGG